MGSEALIARVSAATGGEAESLASRWRKLKPWVDSQFEPGIWVSWFENIIVTEVTELAITLEAPTKFRADYFRQHYAGFLSERIGIQILIDSSPRAYSAAHRKRPATTSSPNKKAGHQVVNVKNEEAKTT